MKQLTKEELQAIKGGSALAIGLSVAAVIVFLAGFIEGFVHPKTCGGEKWEY